MTSNMYCGILRVLRLHLLPPVVVGWLAWRGLLDGRVPALPAERRPPLLVLHAAPPVPLAFLAAILKLNRSSCDYTASPHFHLLHDIHGKILSKILLK